MKHKLKVAWDIIVYKMQTLGQMNQDQGPWFWIHKSGPSTLTFQLLMILDIIVYCIPLYIILFWSEKAVFNQNVIAPNIFSFQ